MLTHKELAVLELKKQGLTQKQIAEKLGISQPAVSSFYNNALKKIADAQEVLRKARDLGYEEGGGS